MKCLTSRQSSRDTSRCPKESFKSHLSVNNKGTRGCLFLSENLFIFEKQLYPEQYWWGQRRSGQTPSSCFQLEDLMFFGKDFKISFVLEISAIGGFSISLDEDTDAYKFLNESPGCWASKSRPFFNLAYIYYR